MLPNTELNVTITDANGITKTFDSNASDPADRPRGIQFGTQLASGFLNGGFSLRRAIDRDNDDVNQLDAVKFIGADGDTAYEGYVGTTPRSMDDSGHTLNVTTAGWIAHAADKPFREIFVDRDLSAWGDMSRARRVQLLTAVPSIQDQGAWETLPDQTTGLSAITQHFQRLATTAGTGPTAIVETWYDAHGIAIGMLYYDETFSNIGAPPTWVVQAALLNADAFPTAGDATANLGGVNSAAYLSATALQTFALVQLQWLGTAALDGEWRVFWRNLAVYGAHGLPLLPGPDPRGVAASDVIRYLAGKYAPLLNTDGVKDTTYPIAHLAFKESTKAYDAFLLLNSYHLWNLAVWEDRTLHFEPIDLTDWDWEIRHDEMGNTIGLQGDGLEDLRNGLPVQFVNVATGSTEVLDPDDYPELRDPRIDNVATTHGRELYGDPFVIPFPTTAADALQLGRTKLAFDSRPKAPGSFTAQYTVRDRSGQLQPAWKVRAGDRIRLTSTANLSDVPRLIHETSYNHDGQTLTIAVDASLQTMEAIIARQQIARQAVGLA